MCGPSNCTVARSAETKARCIPTRHSGIVEPNSMGGEQHISQHNYLFNPLNNTPNRHTHTGANIYYVNMHSMFMFDQHKKHFNINGQHENKKKTTRTFMGKIEKSKIFAVFTVCCWRLSEFRRRNNFVQSGQSLCLYVVWRDNFRNPPRWLSISAGISGIPFILPNAKTFPKRGNPPLGWSISSLPGRFLCPNYDCIKDSQPRTGLPNIKFDYFSFR